MNSTFWGRYGGVIILFIFHLVGIVGMSSPYRQLFAALTPFHLLLSSALLYFYQKSQTALLRKRMIIMVVLGYAIEWIGVHTGFPFGSYHYGQNLGFKISGIPVIIGLNWFILSMGARAVAQRLFLSKALQIAGGAILMVMLDLLIEPVAIQIDYWHWAQNEIPLQNYIAWFVVGLLFQVLLVYRMQKLQNPLAIHVLWIQALFFIVLNLSL